MVVEKRRDVYVFIIRPSVHDLPCEASRSAKMGEGRSDRNLYAHGGAARRRNQGGDRGSAPTLWSKCRDPCPEGGGGRRGEGEGGGRDPNPEGAGTGSARSPPAGKRKRGVPSTLRGVIGVYSGRPRRGSVGPPAGSVRSPPAGNVRSPLAGKGKGLGFRSPGPPRGEAQKGQRRPAGGSVRGPPAGKRKRERRRGRGRERGSGGPPAVAHGARRRTSVRQGDVEEGGNKRGTRKGHDKKQSGREGGREGSKHRDVIRVEKGRGGVEGYQKHVEPGPRDGRGQRGVEIDEEQDGPGRWRGARVVAAAGGRHAVAGISATEKTSHSQGRLCAAAAAEV